MDPDYSYLIAIGFLLIISAVILAYIVFEKIFRSRGTNDHCVVAGLFTFNFLLHTGFGCIIAVLIMRHIDKLAG